MTVSFAPRSYRGRAAAAAAPLVAALTFFLLSVPSAALAQKGGVLVPGSPPLTQEMADRFDRFLEWIFDVPFTREQHDSLQAELVAAWKKKDAEAIKGVGELLNLQEQLGKASDAERQAARGGLQAGLVEELRKDPKDPMNASLLAAYDAAHQPLAPGNPPLTRQMTDAFAEMMWFTLAEVMGEKEAPTPDKNFKDAWAAKITEKYASLEPAQQRSLADMPTAWAGLRLTWPKLTAAEKAKLRSQWKTAFAPATPPKSQTLATVSADKPAKKGPWTPQDEEKPPASATRAERAAWLQRRVAAQQASYQSLSNAVMQYGAAQFNVTSTLSGGAYRYEVRYR
jgi:hypothetical protein